ncbi:polysaccharide deacetylase family protein [Corallococcus carmarthensis]|uniref:polysaccharide deacetylase family protein n=1 Tax=Corallococcus carmarthensis TaxID=2316728 RepID=UPI00148DBC7C|nr:polysaccharide deacetylase family protein [Corallococcus carmarthensis]NOK22744.1 polysaccharide deacetylase family protein [Corallococcus carmarthensis]
MSTRRQFLSGTAVAAGALAVSGAVAAEAPARGTPKASAKKGFWPGGARLAISLSLQFEAGAQPERGASSPFPPIDAKYPDLPVATWYEYGVREGIPRLLEMFSRRGVQVTSHMVGQAVERNPALAKEIVERGHEAAAHGQTWTPQFSMTPEEERASYEANVRAIQRATGQTPVGFNAFWMRGTPRTLEILQDLGFLYHIDDVSRDEPFVVDVRGKPFAVVPYTLGMNDILNFESRNYTADQFASELKNEFDALYAEAGERRRMMSISMHDRISGRPGRVKMLEEFIRYAQRQPGVWFARKDALARWTLDQSRT